MRVAGMTLAGNQLAARREPAAAQNFWFINYYQQNLDKRTPDENVYGVKCANAEALADRRGTNRAKESTTRVRWDMGLAYKTRPG